MQITEEDHGVLCRYTQAIYHLRDQLSQRRLMPVFGAGTSQSISLPNWSDLIVRIAADSRVNATALAGSSRSQASRVQIVFHHFRRQRLASFQSADPNVQGHESAFFERKVASEWRQIVHDCLYQSAIPVAEHPYLREYVAVVRDAPLTVNYNFDDSVQELLDLIPAGKTSDEPTRGFETIWEPTVQFRYQSAVIYHPNGFLPRQLYRGPSPQLVFLEDAFADQLIDAQRGHYSTLLSHYVRFTALLIGLSLEDVTLRHLLRQSTQNNPGHVHYYVAYCPSGYPSEGQQQAIRESNFSAYNLVTLFLSEHDLASLGRLIAAPATEFEATADELGLPPRYVYYLSGAVGVGKTSVLGHFKSLRSFDEWLDEKPAILHRASNTLTDNEKATVDEWINRQMRRRNFAIGRGSCQLCIVDRSPLDPIAFSSPRFADRARELREVYGAEPHRGPCHGTTILLEGHPATMFGRTVDRHKEGSVEYIQALQNRFRALWRLAPKGVLFIDTHDLTVNEVVRRVSRLVHLNSYQAANLGSVLDSVQSSGLTAEAAS
jgi:hypothetical protein